ncbi:MAG: NADH:ubiquinone reductase (Na(+)-transporting) subunit D [Fibrobacterales bacterium]
MSKMNDMIKESTLAQNPILTQTLGVCSALAVTTQVKTALVMTISLMVVVMLSNGIISLLRHAIPSKIRMIVELIIIATLVILTDQILKAFLFQTSKELSVFVGLIITNCIVMGRAEAFALGNKPLVSVLDGFGSGIGYGVILILVSTFREILGAGSWFGFKIVPDFLYDLGYTDMGLMVLAPGAFFLVGIIGWLQNNYLIKKGAK